MGWCCLKKFLAFMGKITHLSKLPGLLFPFEYATQTTLGHPREKIPRQKEFYGSTFNFRPKTSARNP
jgi:hypothetical protein